MLATLAATSILAPVPSGAQSDDDPSPGDQARRGSGQIDLDIDVLRVENTEVETALTDLATNVATQRAELQAAQARLFEAEAALGEAQAAVQETQGQIDGLTEMTDGVVIDMFMSPPTERALEALAADSITDAAVEQSILETQATADAEVIGRLQEARDQLEVEQATEQDAADLAEARAADAEAELADLESALSQQAAFVSEVERRLDQRLAEATLLEGVNPALAEQIRAREYALAAVLASLQEEALRQAAQDAAAALSQAAEDQMGYGVIKEPPGGLATVACPGGGSIVVAGDIASQVTRLLEDAAADGIMMCGTGFRDPQDQIALRRANCGTSTYAIYQAPSSACSPPTARPGTSMHEQGLAIDFTCNGGGTVSSGDVCDDWLENHAADYGLYNLASEAWHYSVNGE